MATVAPSTDCRRRAVLTAALSRTSAAVLFLGVVVVGAVASARWITSTTAVSSSKLSPFRCCRSLCRASLSFYDRGKLREQFPLYDRERVRELTRLRFWDESSTRHRRRRVWVYLILGVWATFLFLSPFR
jgi:hypothetical protein